MVLLASERTAHSARSEKCATIGFSENLHLYSHRMNHLYNSSNSKLISAFLVKQPTSVMLLLKLLESSQTANTTTTESTLLRCASEKYTMMYTVGKTSHIRGCADFYDKSNTCRLNSRNLNIYHAYAAV